MSRRPSIRDSHPDFLDYLGDGLYVGFDGYQLALAANSPDTPTDIVYLDPEILDNFLKYIDVIKGVKNESQSATTE